jgi:hypothetical protein
MEQRLICRGRTQAAQGGHTRGARFCHVEWPVSYRNAPDVMFSIAANVPIRLGIGKESITVKPSKAFSYVPPQA